MKIYSKEWLLRGISGILLFILLAAAPRVLPEDVARRFLIPCMVWAFVSALGAVRCFWVAFDKKEALSQMIDSQDEREREVRLRAGYAAYRVTYFFCLAADLLVIGLWYWKKWEPLSHYIFALTTLVVLMDVVYWAAGRNLQKRL